MIKVFRYGTPACADKGDLLFREQLMLTRDMWNTAVGEEEAHEAAKDALWAGHPLTRDPWEKAARLRGELADLHKEAAAHRSADRSTRPRTDMASSLASVRQELKDALDELAQARELAYPELAEAFAELKQSCRTCQCRRSSPPDSLYKQYRSYGLGWGTVNDVLQRRLPGAMKKVKEGSELHRKPGDGTGSLTIQLQAGRGRKEGVSPVPEVLSREVHPWARDFRLERQDRWRPRNPGDPAPTAARLEKYWQVRLRLSERCTIVIPFIMHTPIPAEGVIKEVKVTRFRTGSRYRMRIVFVVHVPDPVQPEGGVVFIQPRWSKDKETGGILAATVGSTAPLAEVPHDLRHFVKVNEDGMSAEIQLPFYVQELRDLISARQGRRDKAQEEIRQQMAAAIAGTPSLEEATGVTSGTVTMIRRPDKLHRIARKWPQDHPLRPGLDAWRKQDRHRQDSVAHEGDQLTEHRRDAWKKTGAWVCQGVRTLAIGTVPVAKVRPAPLPGEEEDGRARERSRQQIQAGAPGELRELIANAARMRAIPVRDTLPGLIGDDDAGSGSQEAA